MPWPPTVPEIAAAPELAALAALVAVLDLALDALLAAHPDLDDDDRPPWRPPPSAVPAAARLVDRAVALRRALDRYRRAITAPPRDSPPIDGLPF
jgi:hypothetical protein